MCNAWNHSANCGCGFGGDTGGGGFAGPAVTWDAYNDPLPLTFLTNCWWCGAEVFFHRAYNGGCALFDDLGPPWPVYSCWKEYRHDLGCRSRIDNDLLQRGFNGRNYVPRRRALTRPVTDDHRVDLKGFVQDNHFLYGPSKVRQLKASSRASSPSLIRVDVTDGRSHALPIYLPLEIARRVHDYAIARVTGKWLQRCSRWILLAKTLELIATKKDWRGHFRAFDIPDVIACRYCGMPFSPTDKWGIDPELRFECTQCAAARGPLSPDAFAALCSRISERSS
jgi:hypothetical protein